MAIVCGSIVASLFEPNSQKTGVPCAVMTMPYGFESRVGTSRSSILPLPGSSRPARRPDHADVHPVSADRTRGWRRVPPREAQQPRYRGMDEPSHHLTEGTDWAWHGAAAPASCAGEEARHGTEKASGSAGGRHRAGSVSRERRRQEGQGG